MPIAGVGSALLVFVILMIALVGTVVLLVSYGLSYFRPGVKAYLPAHKKIWAVLAAIVVLSDIASLYVFYEMRKIDAEIAREQANKKAREDFVLQQDRPYGELILPRGTRIKRYDPFDRGEEQREFRLTGLSRAEFPHPVKIAGVWASAVEPIGKVILAKDQSIYRYDCKAGQMAFFQVPRMERDPIESFGREEPDGKDADFRPSQWSFFNCSDPW